MKTVDRVRRHISTQFHVNSARLARWLRRLSTDDLLTIYEEASNLYFHEEALQVRAYGAVMLSAAVDEVERRFPEAVSLNLRDEPYPFRSWVAGVPQTG